MGTKSLGNGSANGDGRSHLVVDGEGPVHDPLGRFVTLLVREAVARKCSEIVVERADACCLVHLVRGDERLKMDSPPARLFAPIKQRVARMCGQTANDGQGTFTTSLKKTETGVDTGPHVTVSVRWGASDIHFTICVGN